jgi:hypothetical protein
MGKTLYSYIKTEKRSNPSSVRAGSTSFEYSALLEPEVGINRKIIIFQLSDGQQVIIYDYSISSDLETTGTRVRNLDYFVACLPNQFLFR